MDKMADTEQTNNRYLAGIFKYIFFDGNHCISIRISLRSVLKYPIENKSALVQVITWRQTDKVLPESMMVQFCDAIRRHQATMTAQQPDHVRVNSH